MSTVQRDEDEEARISGVGDEVTLEKLPVDIAAVAGADVTSVNGAISGIQAAIEYAKAKAGGQSTLEAASSAGGGAVGNAAAGAVMTPAMAGTDAVINAVDAAVKRVEGPRAKGDTSVKTSDATTLVADATRTKLLTGYAGAATRTVTSLATGDVEGVNRTGRDVEAGKYGAPLQGTKMAFMVAHEAIKELADGSGNLHRVTANGQDSAAARVGNALGDAAADAAGHNPSNVDAAAHNAAGTARVVAQVLSQIGPPIPYASWDAWHAAGAPLEPEGNNSGAGGAPPI